MNDDCVFCAKIAAGDYDELDEPAHAVTFTPMNPVTPGHRLFVPVLHVVDALDDTWETGRVMRYATRWAKEHGTGDCNLITSCGPAATQTVLHLHVHLVPRVEGDGLILPWTDQEVGAEPQYEDGVVIYTDGACSGNPGPGGWGAVIRRYGEKLLELHGADVSATNNKMELTAAIRALEALDRPSRVTLHTDSEYLRCGMTQWVRVWQGNGWRASRGPVVNADLWQELVRASARHEVTWVRVAGHSGDPGNEQADRLARLGSREARGLLPVTGSASITGS